MLMIKDEKGSSTTPEKSKPKGDGKSSLNHGVTETSSSTDDWSLREAKIFAGALEVYGKNFGAIKRSMLPWVSVRSMIDHYYQSQNQPVSTPVTTSNTIQTMDDNSPLDLSSTGTPGPTGSTSSYGVKSETDSQLDNRNNNNYMTGGTTTSGSKNRNSNPDSGTSQQKFNQSLQVACFTSSTLDHNSQMNGASCHDLMSSIMLKRVAGIPFASGSSTSSTTGSLTKKIMTSHHHAMYNNSSSPKLSGTMRHHNHDHLMSGSSLSPSSSPKQMRKNSDDSDMILSSSHHMNNNNGINGVIPYGEEVKALKAKPKLPNYVPEGSTTATSLNNNNHMGSLKFFMDGQLVLKLNAKQQENSESSTSKSGKKCQWVASQDTPKILKPPVRNKKHKLLCHTSSSSASGAKNSNSNHSNNNDGPGSTGSSSDGRPETGSSRASVRSEDTEDGLDEDMDDVSSDENA